MTYDDRVRAMLGWPTATPETPRPDLADELRALLAEKRRGRERDLATHYPGQPRRGRPN